MIPINSLYLKYYLKHSIKKDIQFLHSKISFNFCIQFIRLILTRLYISYTRDVCGLRRSAVSWLNDVFEEKHTYKFWQKEFKRNGVHEALKIREPDM